MLNKVITDYLKGYLDSCFVNIDVDQLQTSLFSGQIRFQNLELNPDFVNYLIRSIHPSFAPLKMQRGTCKSLQVNVSLARE